MKKILSSVFAAAFILLTPLSAQEDVIPLNMNVDDYDTSESDDGNFDHFLFNDETDFCVLIDDEADILSIDEEKKLIECMFPVTQWGDAAFYSFNEDYGMPVKDLAESYYDMLLSDDGSGSVFLADVYNGEFYIYSGGDIASVIDAETTETIMENVAGYADQGDFFTSSTSAFILLSGLASSNGLPVGSSKEAAVPTDGAFQTLSYTNSETGYTAILRDGADILSDEEEKKLLGDMKAVTEWGNAIFYSTYEGSGSSAEDFAATVYEDTFGKEVSGSIFLVDMDRRWLQIHTDGSVNRIITSNYCQSITDNIYKMASVGDYYSCAAEAYTEMTTLLKGGKISQPMKHASNALFAIIIAMIICYIYMKSNGKTESERAQEKAHPVFKGSLNNLSVTKGKLTSVTHSSSSGGGSRGGGGGHSGGGGGHGF
ncbi:MAG: TPM domain-containing protein [Treponema sp.]|nr:TPM domain-containing protein [Treponema sp.]